MSSKSIFRPENLVLSGGGMKGFLLVGAFCTLLEWGMLSNINTVACTSIGAFVASMWCLGFSSDEMCDAFMSVDFEGLFHDMRPTNMISFGYFCDGRWFEDLISSFIRKKRRTTKPDISLKELYDLSGIRLIMNTVLRKGEGEIRLMDYVSTPELSLIEAIRKTSCIPGGVKPLLWDGYECYDGGVLDNYMIWMFPPETTLGLYLGRRSIDKEPDDEFLYKKKSTFFSDLGLVPGIKNFMELVWDMFSVTGLALEKERTKHKYREIIIDSGNIKTLSLDTKDEKKRQMVMKGIREALKFIVQECSD